VADNWQSVGADIPEPEIVVLDDAGLGFREMKDYWPESVRNQQCGPWYVLKMADPVADGSLWKQLITKCADRLIVVMTVNDLRRREVQISRQLSWERTAQDVLWELNFNNEVNSLLTCAHTIISFDTAGAVLLSRDAGDGEKARLFFDPKIVEGEWNRKYDGMMIGYNTTLTAGVVRQLMLHPESPDMAASVQSSVAAMRYLHSEGYGRGRDNFDLKFPLKGVADVLAMKPEKPLSVATIHDPLWGSASSADGSTAADLRGYWTILGDLHAEGLDEVAYNIAQKGLEYALNEVPVAKLGNLTTVDRREIEALHSIQSLMEEYVSRSEESPVSIAVFGPPGAGKSFYVKQVAKIVLSKKSEPLTFNLSQLTGPEQLLGALHRVRDQVVTGHVPLVFWDEFDTSLDGELGWLRYFLAPMQDGTFQDGPITRPIGRCIFVFAGGTSESMEEFENQLDADERKRKMKKLPDFVSCLKGYLDIRGPNPVGKDTQADREYVVRRAILLRVMLSQAAKDLFQPAEEKQAAAGGQAPATKYMRLNIDSGVLRAFLKSSSYRHGARSMKSIITMSRLKGKTSFERTCLPSQAQMDLHVHGAEFLANVYFDKLTDEQVEVVAKAVHAAYCRGIDEQVKRLNDRKHDANSETEYVENDDEKELRNTREKLQRDYSQIDEEEQEQNRGNARDIENKLRQIGCVVLPQRGTVQTFEFSVAEVEQLAEEEHKRWRVAKLAADWQPGEETDKSRKIHKCLVDWDKLPEVEREKDRILVRHIPSCLEKLGYTVLRLPR
jgi:hypothetical protein